MGRQRRPLFSLPTLSALFRSPNNQLALFRDTFVMPLVAQIRELEHRLADVENAHDQAKQERDELAAMLGRLSVEQNAAAVAPSPEPEDLPPPTAFTLGVAWRRRRAHLLR